MENELRKSSWFELFFDLVFVMVVAQLVHKTHIEHMTILYLLKTIFMVVVVFDIWIGYSQYTDMMGGTRWDSNWFPLSIGMFLSVLLTHAVGSTFNHVYGEIFIILFLAHLHVGILYFINIFKNSKFKDFFIFIGTFQFVLACLYMLGYYLSFQLYGLIFLLTLQLVASFIIFVGFSSNKDYPTQNSHMDERLGLFTLIIMGELITIMGISFETSELSISSLLKLALVCFSILYMTMLYFSRSDETYMTKALQSLAQLRKKSTILMGTIYIYVHLFMYVSLVLFIISLKGILLLVSFTKINILMVFLSLALYLGSLLIIQLVTKNLEKEAIITKIIAITTAVLCALFISKEISVWILILIIDGVIILSPFLYNILWKRFLSHEGILFRRKNL